MRPQQYDGQEQQEHGRVLELERQHERGELLHDADGEAAPERAEQAARGFQETYAGKLSATSGAGLAAALGEFERIDEILGRVMSYAQLLFACYSTDPTIGRFYQTVN